MTRTFSLYFLYPFFLISIKCWNSNLLHCARCIKHAPHLLFFFSHLCAASSSLLSPLHPHLPQLSLAHHFFTSSHFLPLSLFLSSCFLSSIFPPCPVPFLPYFLLPLFSCPALSSLSPQPSGVTREHCFFSLPFLRWHPCLFPVLPSPHLCCALSLVLPKLSCRWPIKPRGCYFRCGASCRWLSETKTDTEREREKRMCVRKVEVTPLAAIPFCFISPFPRYFIIFKTTVTPPPSLRSSKPTFSSSPLSLSPFLHSLSSGTSFSLPQSKNIHLAPSPPAPTPRPHPAPFCSVIQSWRQSAEGWVMMFCRENTWNAASPSQS